MEIRVCVLPGELWLSLSFLLSSSMLFALLIFFPHMFDTTVALKKHGELNHICCNAADCSIKKYDEILRTIICRKPITQEGMRRTNYFKTFFA